MYKDVFWYHLHQESCNRNILQILTHQTNNHWDCFVSNHKSVQRKNQINRFRTWEKHHMKITIKLPLVETTSTKEKSHRFISSSSGHGHCTRSSSSFSSFKLERFLGKMLGGNLTGSLFESILHVYIYIWFNTSKVVSIWMQMRLNLFFVF